METPLRHERILLVHFTRIADQDELSMREIFENFSNDGRFEFESTLE